MSDAQQRIDELVKGNNTIFVATGVTDGQLVSGVRREGNWVHTESIVLRGASGTLLIVSTLNEQGYKAVTAPDIALWSVPIAVISVIAGFPARRHP